MKYKIIRRFSLILTYFKSSHFYLQDIKLSNVRIKNTGKYRKMNQTVSLMRLVVFPYLEKKGFMKKIFECDSENPSKCICDDKDDDLFSFQQNRLDRLAIYYQDNNKNALAKKFMFFPLKTLVKIKLLYGKRYQNFFIGFCFWFMVFLFYL